jgi:hypothetical protein
MPRQSGEFLLEKVLQTENVTNQPYDANQTNAMRDQIQNIKKKIARFSTPTILPHQIFASITPLEFSLFLFQHIHFTSGTRLARNPKQTICIAGGRTKRRIRDSALSSSGHLGALS